jgi:hypothetical protein
MVKQRSAPTLSKTSIKLDASFFMLRSPLLSLEDYRAIALNAEISHLKTALQLPYVKEAIFAASNSLYERLSTGGYEPGQDLRLDDALLRYLSRMSTRSTPFGLFSAVSCGYIQNEEKFLNIPNASIRRHARLDNEILCQICQSLLEFSYIARSIHWLPNDTLLRMGDVYRYTEIELAKGQRVFRLSQASVDDALECVIKTAEGGNTLGAIEVIVSTTFPYISLNEVQEFIADIIAADLLSPELQPCITGEDGLTSILQVLRLRGVQGEEVELLERISEALRSLNASEGEAETSRYEYIFSEVKKIRPDTKLGKTFQLDCYRDTAELAIDSSILDSLTTAVRVSLALSDANRGGLDAFKEKFRERYETKRVPLLLAADDEMGIGVNSVRDHTDPILENVPFAGQVRSDIKFGAIERYLFPKFESAIASGERVVNLDPVDFPDPAEPDETVPQFLAAMFSMVKLNIAPDPYVVLNSLGGPSGAELIGRFCHGNKTLLEETQKFLAQEGGLDPEAIFAEIAHLPQGRIGNISSRPLMRKFEIVFRGKSGAEQARQIELSDLSLQIIDNKLTLWSESLGKRVVPRLSCAHNIDRDTIGVYRLLAKLQYEGVRSLALGWGTIDNIASFLPRLSCGRVIFSLARWRITKLEIESVKKHPGGLTGGALALRERRGLDEVVSLVDGDNVLRLNLSSADSLRNFLSLVEDRGICTLQEVLDIEDGAVLEIGGKRYSHEIVLPMQLKWQ